MGQEVCRAVFRAEDLELVAGVDRTPGTDPIVTFPDRPDVDVPVSDKIEILRDVDAEVAVDFTHASTVLGNVSWCLDRGIHAVVGTSGIAPQALDEIRDRAQASEANAIVVPNFAIGAVLMMRFAEEAARHFDAAEVIELHHDTKADAPSGTALATARRVAGARAGMWRPPAGDEGHPGARGADVDDIRVHSVRLPGLVAHQEVIFGGPGQTLTVRHDSTDRTSFMPGVLLAIRAVGSRPGLTVGLEPLLESG
jgi:4-hydroxy-tetrahydrodipicolinate reductase